MPNWSATSLAIIVWPRLVSLRHCFLKDFPEPTGLHSYVCFLGSMEFAVGDLEFVACRVGSGRFSCQFFLKSLFFFWHASTR